MSELEKRHSEYAHCKVETDMVCRVAARLKAMGPGHDVHDYARAAIEAMYEPTDEVLQAMGYEDIEWKAGIRAALK